MKCKALYGLLLCLVVSQASAGLEKRLYEVYLRGQFKGFAKYYLVIQEPGETPPQYASGFSTMVQRPLLPDTPQAPLNPDLAKFDAEFTSQTKTLLATNIGSTSNAPACSIESLYPPEGSDRPPQHTLKENQSASMRLHPQIIRSCDMSREYHPLCLSRSLPRTVALVHFIHTQRVYHRCCQPDDIDLPELI